MKTKAQGLPMNTIIIAVLVLAVLGFVGYMLAAKGIGPFAKGLGECKDKGGECKESCTAGMEIKSFKGCYTKTDGKDDYKKDWVCCIPVT